MTDFRRASCTVLALTAVLGMATSGRLVFAADNLDSVIAKLDSSAKNFKSAQADILWDNVQVKPIEDDDKQVGTVLFERKSDQMQVAVHLKTDNGQPVQKDMVYAAGIGKLYEARLKQMQVFKLGDKRAEMETFLTLGFGGSGQDLKKNWTVDYAGTEALNGVTAAKLQLVPRDASLAKTAPKVLLWIDMDKGVALKQQRFDPAGNYVVFTYSNIRLNTKISSDAFEIKTAPGTQTVNH
jgi:outer membrane lipoprotein-sorting protein